MYYCDDKEVLDRVRQAVESGREIWIYPNGDIGRYFKSYLKENYKIDVKKMLDNRNYNGADILNLQQAAESEENALILVCSDNCKIYKEIRERLYQYFAQKDIIDLFPPMEFEEEKAKELLKKMSGYIESVEREC